MGDVNKRWLPSFYPRLELLGASTFVGGITSLGVDGPADFEVYLDLANSITLLACHRINNGACKPCLPGPLSGGPLLR